MHERGMDGGIASSSAGDSDSRRAVAEPLGLHEDTRDVLGFGVCEGAKGDRMGKHKRAR